MHNHDFDVSYMRYFFSIIPLTKTIAFNDLHFIIPYKASKNINM